MADPKLAISITTDPNHEGGFVNNPNDPGGATKYGITERDARLAFPDINVVNLTLDQAQHFYLTTNVPQRYHNPLYEKITSQALHNKLFDMGVLFGVSEAVGALQKAVDVNEHVLWDGKEIPVFGSITLAAVNAATAINDTVTMAMYKIELAKYVTQVIKAHPSETEFQKGWLARVRSDADKPVPYPA